MSVMVPFSAPWIRSKAACTEFAPELQRPDDTVNEFRVVINSKKDGASKLMAMIAPHGIKSGAHLKNGDEFLTSLALCSFCSMKTNSKDYLERSYY
ncbi:hypothetical protein CDAR_566291 [Caerostris darwini]|uniref:Uncharacterized protein n=1 Tax=Caerostris darwini TaxID=1538125 RepID=A0AAV4UDI2_9ARAC|nr:hypothetical protein CDAR_566291 [Caerostris darwini]